MRSVEGPRSIAALVLLGLDACSVGPRYTRPDIPAPMLWRTSAQSAPTPQSSNSPPRPAWPSGDWMRGFHSQQLDELIAQARDANDDIGAAIARVREADALAHIAGAAILPSVSASSDATRARQTSRNLVPVSYDTFSATLSASYQLDFWGKYRATRDAARSRQVQPAR